MVRFYEKICNTLSLINVKHSIQIVNYSNINDRKSEMKVNNTDKILHTGNTK